MKKLRPAPVRRTGIVRATTPLGTCNAVAKPFILKSISGVAFGRRVLEQVTPELVFMEGAEITDMRQATALPDALQADLYRPSAASKGIGVRDRDTLRRRVVPRTILFDLSMPYLVRSDLANPNNI
jgi:hypothetical protein